LEPEGADARLTALYERHYDDVLAYCVRRVGRSDADEAAADVFAIAWRRIDDLEWDTARPWLFGVARGVVANRWRSRRRSTRLPDEQVGRRVETEEILSVVRRLGANDREVLMLAAWEGLSGPEIARALGISVAAAEQRLHRAKRRLVRMLPSPRREVTRHGAREGEIR
jgi:RNA polymerase sigma-70 factor (ECF subfamily)